MPTAFDDDPYVRSARLHLRLSPAALSRLREAAALRQQDVTSFVLGAALQRASDVVADEHRTRLRVAALAGGRGFSVEDPALLDDCDTETVRDPDDPDDDLWDDPRVTREPPELRALIFELLKDRRRKEREPTEALDPPTGRPSIDPDADADVTPPNQTPPDETAPDGLRARWVR